MLCMRSKVVLLPTADGVHPWSMGMKLEAGSRCDEEASRCMTRMTRTRVVCGCRSGGR